jgi:RnfABCDGE-type electron transport complex G subunit
MAERVNLTGPVLVAAFCALVLSITHLTTATQIADNQRLHDQRALRELLGDALPATELAAQSWQANQLVWCSQHIVVSRLETDGYAGSIKLLLAWRSDRQQIIGISVLQHLETPGIGDFLNDRAEGSWLDGFRQRSMNTAANIDTVTGATISSNAIIRAVGTALQRPESAVSRCAT